MAANGTRRWRITIYSRLSRRRLLRAIILSIIFSLESHTPPCLLTFSRFLAVPGRGY